MSKDLHRDQKEHLKQILARFSNLKVLVLGDLILDEYVWGNVSRISPEAPVPVVEVTKRFFSPGGASYVASLIQNLDGIAFPVGVVGNDPMARRLRALLGGEKSRLDGMVEDGSRPTTHKTRVMAQRQQIVRIDQENNARVSPAVVKQLMKKIHQRIGQVDAVVISDYAKGVLTPPLVQDVIRQAKKRKLPVVVDPKPASGIEFRGATIVTPNSTEAGQMTGQPIKDERTVLEAGRRLLKKVGCDHVLITRGEHGMSLFERGGGVRHIPTRAREVFDVSGAGDAVVSTLALALAAEASLFQAAELANYAAGVEVGKLGTAKITRREIESAIDQA